MGTKRLFENCVTLCKNEIKSFEKFDDFLFGLSTDPNRKEICRRDGFPRELSDCTKVENEAKKKVAEAIKKLEMVPKNDFQGLKKVHLECIKNIYGICNDVVENPYTDSDIKEDGMIDIIERREKLFNEQNKK